MSAAIQGRFHGLNVGVFESRISKGGSFSHTPTINNVPDYPLELCGATLAESTIQQFKKLGGSFFAGTLIRQISRQDFFVLKDQNNNSYFAKTIILATGVAYKN